jgi:hypothetical protein
MLAGQAAAVLQSPTRDHRSSSGREGATAAPLDRNSAARARRRNGLRKRARHSNRLRRLLTVSAPRAVAGGGAVLAAARLARR